MDLGECYFRPGRIRHDHHLCCPEEVIFPQGLIRGQSVNLANLGMSLTGEFAGSGLQPSQRYGKVFIVTQ